MFLCFIQNHLFNRCQQRSKIAFWLALMEMCANVSASILRAKTHRYIYHYFFTSLMFTCKALASCNKALWQPSIWAEKEEVAETQWCNNNCFLHWQIAELLHYCSSHMQIIFILRSLVWHDYVTCDQTKHKSALLISSLAPNVPFWQCPVRLWPHTICKVQTTEMHWSGWRPKSALCWFWTWQKMYPK